MNDEETSTRQITLPLHQHPFLLVCQLKSKYLSKEEETFPFRIKSP